MAAVPITIVGTVTDGDGHVKNVTIMGLASLTGIGIGGGPIMPPEPVDPSYGIPGPPYPKPPGIWGPTDPRPGYWVPGAPGSPGYGTGIWGPTDPRPTPPIYIPPTQLPDLPVHIWGPTDPRPNPPIYLPTPEPPPGSLVDWKPVWTPDTGWVVIGIPNVPVPTPSKK